MTYEHMQAELGRGWNTWNTFNVFSHVLLPEALAINLSFCVRGLTRHKVLRSGFIGHYPHARKPETDTSIPGVRSYDGRYTQLDVTWLDMRFTVESATEGDDLVLLITPVSGCESGIVAAEACVLWGREGMTGRVGETLILRSGQREVRLEAEGERVDEPYLRSEAPYLALSLARPVAFCTGAAARTLEAAQQIVARRRAEVLAEHARYGEQQELYTALQTAMAWNTIYDPSKNRVISPVSRVWNYGWGSYVLFCWDTYFAGLMAGIDNKQLAYANVVEITREMTPGGYVPNYAAYPERKSYDRSQPPVGAMVAWRLFERWGDTWFLEEIYTNLLTWNRWWDQRRRVAEKYLAWGSNRIENWMGNPGEQGRGAAILESGLDNSPLYDQATYDEAAEVLNMADAGLIGMYIGDCRALARMADVLGKSADAHELNERADHFTASCQELWDEAAGIFLNRHTDTNLPNPRLSPTNFYPLMGEVASLDQAQRMIKEHLYNPDEFWGEWMLPSCSRSDPAFIEQRYWRGPIWGPMNMLVYMGLQNYDLPEARRDLAQKSAHVLLKEWREHRHIHENYNSMTGEGCSSPHSNPFYHWGALLALIPLMEAGHYQRAH